MKTILNYFFRGMLIVLPASATVYFTYATLKWMNEVFNNLFFSQLEISIPGLGILTAFVAITLIGFIISRTFIMPLVHYFERLFVQMPLISIVYSSLKDLTEAFVGDKKKFDKPVMVQLNESGMKRFGFVTEESLDQFRIPNDVAVYCPHSYNFSGNVYFVPKEAVTPINADPTDFMRFIVSGGVTRVMESKK
ncbi:MAG: DUF502 domain-containing protein [Balneolaceae bacterium]|nr:DUF502 domain-containing protein [Balneolaceae bacterium]